MIYNFNKCILIILVLVKQSIKLKAASLPIAKIFLNKKRKHKHINPFSCRASCSFTFQGQAALLSNRLLQESLLLV